MWLRVRGLLVVALLVAAAGAVDDSESPEVTATDKQGDTGTPPAVNWKDFIMTMSDISDDTPVDELLKTYATPAVELNNRFVEKDESGAVNDEPTLGQLPDEETLNAFRGYVSPGVMAAVKKVYFFADLHGDLLALDAVLKLIDLPEEDRASTMIVSSGDFMDRGPEDLTIWKTFWNIRKQGYKLVTVNGNHESMVAGGSWRYRSMAPVMRRALSLCKKNLRRDNLVVKDCGKFIEEAFSEDKNSVLSCNGDFNKFVRKVMSPVALLTHPSHDKKVVISHGGVSPQWAEKFIEHNKDVSKSGKPSLEAFVQRVRDMYGTAMDAMCSENEDKIANFKPSVVASDRFNMMVSRGYMNSLEGCSSAGVDDSFNKAAVGVGIDDRGSLNDPTWDRTYQASSQYSGPLYNIQKFDELFRADIRQVVGHTPRSDALASPDGRLFGVDTAMSRGLCRTGGEGCQYTVLMFQNFGSSSWATDPRIIKLSTRRNADVDAEDPKVTQDQILQPATCHEFVPASSRADMHSGRESWKAVSCDEQLVGITESDSGDESVDPFADADALDVLSLCRLDSFSNPCALRPSNPSVSPDDCMAECEEMSLAKSSMYSCRWDTASHKCVPSDAGQHIVNQLVKSQLENEAGPGLPQDDRSLATMRLARGLPSDPREWRAHLEVTHEREIEAAIADEESKALAAAKALVADGARRREKIIAELEKLEVSASGLRGKNEPESSPEVKTLQAELEKLDKEIRASQDYIDSIEGVGMGMMRQSSSYTPEWD